MLAVVTGANRGIGLEFCRQLAASGVSVLAGCRRASSELAELTNVQVVEGVDVTGEAGVRALGAAVGERTVDILINNAGVLQSSSLVPLEVETIQRQFEVNALGPLRVVSELVPKLGQGSKVALITSRMGSLSDNTSGGSYGYRMSKAALNMAGVSLAQDLKPRGVAVAILHPGWVRTEMTRGSGNLSAAESAAGLLARVKELTLENSGTFWHSNGERLPW